MDKTQLKNFAIWARRRLIEDIKRKAEIIGITENGIQDEAEASANGLQIFEVNGQINKLYGKDIEKRKSLIEQIKLKEEETDYKTAFNYIIEEVAYTWFNRIIAIRYMEINDYLPSRIRILSSIENSEPEIMKRYIDADLVFTEKELQLIEEYEDTNKPDDLFALIFIKQSNALNEILPELFEKTADYMEILLNISFTTKDSLIGKLINEVGEENFKNNVEVVGWLYQYYNTEPKEQTDTLLKKNVKVTKERLPFKTQLFTPDWIVKYMVENSLGRLWLEKEENEDLKKGWKYYIDEAEQETEVKEQLEEIRKCYKNLDIEDIKIIDPCMGSGHMLTYTFDVLIEIYESRGYSTREAVKSIIENNIYGIELSKRAYQLAYFAIMMKARQYDSRIFRRNLKNNLCYTEDKSEIPFIEKFNNKEMINCVRDLENSDLLGSLIETEAIDYENLIDTIESFNIIDLGVEYSNAPEKRIAILKNQIKLHYILSQKYDVVITNPPYLGGSAMNNLLKKYLEKKYPNSKSDLFAAFIERCLKLCKNNKYVAMITQHQFMFLSSYEKLRKDIINKSFVNMIHLGTNAFEEIKGEVVQATTFIINNNNINNYKSTYFRLVDKDTPSLKEESFLNRENKFISNSENFSKIPSSPIAYWASEKIFDIFENSKSLGEIASPKQGLATADNDRFLRLWYEVEKNKIKFGAKNSEEFLISKCKYAPYNKGGVFRRWFGNDEFIVNWENDGLEIKNFRNEKGKLKSRPQNLDYYFKESISWGLITSSEISFRYKNYGNIFDVAGMSCFINDKNKLKYLLALNNTKMINVLLQFIASTMNYQIGDIARIPIKFDEQYMESVVTLADENISISKKDWDSFETSYDFIRHQLLNYGVSIYSGLGDGDKECISNIKIDNNNGKILIFEKDKSKAYRIEESFEMYKDFCNNTFNRLKENEEKLNEIFIKIYSLENELTPYVEDKDITITKIFDNKEDITENIKGNKYILTKKDVIKSFISYAVGCMLGRYSLDVDGLAYSGGEWDNSKYNTFKPVEQNCLLILEEEIPELKNNDIVNNFIQFIEVVFGKDTLEENLQFIADALEIKAKTNKEAIRTYFVKDFYKEHLQTYKKCPIYWLFDAGKNNSFKALIYLHRYNTNTIGMINVEFLQKVQEAYERFKSVEDKAKIIEKYNKKLVEIKEYSRNISNLANLQIDLDLDDGVKTNYKKLQANKDGKILPILAENKTVFKKEK